MPASALAQVYRWLQNEISSRGAILGRSNVGSSDFAKGGALDLSTSPLLISDTPASFKHVQAAILLAVTLLAGFLITLPVRHVQWPVLTPFIPMVDTALFLGDLLTATLLYAHFAVTRSRALLALATGYCFTGLIIIPHALTFPGAFAPTGLLGAGVNSTIWLYFFWHTALPISVCFYAGLRSGTSEPIAAEHKDVAIFASIAVSLALVVGLTWLATAGHDRLPNLMSDAVNWLPVQVWSIAIPLLLLSISAIVLLVSGRKSVLDVWLMLMLWAWMIELLMVMFTSSRYSMLWYVGRTYGLLSGVIVLVVLLSETTKLYARLAISAAARKYECESRLMTMNAVAGSIAHEVNQPLTAIVSNANAGLRWLKREPPDFARVANVLDAIVNDGHRASDVVSSIRSMFGKKQTEKRLSDINDIANDAVTLVSSELERHQIIVRLRLSKGLSLVACDRVQMRQVFLNLLNNAIESLDRVPSRRRLLIVQSLHPTHTEVVVRIKDTGVGLPPDELERIFEPFFTTKANGTGLGLSICRSIVESHGGRLWATRRPSNGSIFHVSLPGH